MAVRCFSCEITLTKEEAQSGQCPICRTALSGRPPSVRLASSNSTPPMAPLEKGIPIENRPRRLRKRPIQKRYIVVWIILGSIVVIALGVAGFFMVRQAMQRARFRTIAKELRSMTNEDVRKKPNIRQKVLVWDFENNTRVNLKTLGAQSNNRDATAPDEPFTVLLILKKRKIYVGTGEYGYGKKMRIKVYREEVEAAVFDWPEKKYYGKHDVSGSRTIPIIIHRKNRNDSSPVINSYKRELMSWILKHSS